MITSIPPQAPYPSPPSLPGTTPPPPPLMSLSPPTPPVENPRRVVLESVTARLSPAPGRVVRAARPENFEEDHRATDRYKTGHFPPSPPIPTPTPKTGLPAHPPRSATRAQARTRRPKAIAEASTPSPNSNPQRPSPPGLPT